jgi:hypothetical protein
MPTTIKLKNSVTTTNVPSSLAQGEVAINVTDKKVWVGNAATTPVQLLGGGADGSFTNISVSSVATFGAGTVSAPSITTTGDTNTGIYFPATDTIAFTEGGVESMRITSASDVGIGTSSPTTKLDVNGTATAKGAIIANGANGQVQFGSTSTYNIVGGVDNGGFRYNLPTGLDHQFRINGSDVMRITSAGNVGIGTSSPAQKLTLTNGTFQINGASTFSSNVEIGRVGGDNNMAFATGGTERMRIDSGGRVLVGSTSSYNANSKLQVTSANIGVDNGAGGQAILAITADAFATNAGASLGLGGKASSGSNIVFGAIAGRYEGTGNAGYLQFATISSGGTMAERMRIDSSGNLGLGVTPSTWASYKAIQFSAQGSIASASNATYFGNNWYTDGTNKYIQSGTAGLAGWEGNTFKWYQAASGTAGDAITFTNSMTLDANGVAYIGGTSGTAARLNLIKDTNSTVEQLLFLRNNGTGYKGVQISFGEYGTSQGYITNQNISPSGIWCTDIGGTDTVRFFTGSAPGTERMRITSSGDLLVGKTTSSETTNGIIASGQANDAYLFVTSTIPSSGSPIIVNRQSSDGTLISFRHANTTEGTISVSGTTVSYNGGHLARYAQTLTAKDESILKGTVLSNLDEMNTYVDADGNVAENEQLNKVKVSDVEGDANVAGVFVNWSFDEQHNVDEINMAMTGDMIIRIAEGVTVQRGDLLMSAGDGTAKPQGDDIVRGKTIAKVTSTHVTCTYADGSYCVPCVLMAC